MKRATFVVFALALVVAPVAAAKDLTRAEVCGQSGCAALPRDARGDGLIQLRGSEGREVSAAPKTAPYYLLVWEFGPPAEDGQTARFATLYAPSAELVAAPGMEPGSIEWFGASAAVLEKVRRATAGVEPYSAPRQWPTEISPPALDAPAAPVVGTDGRDWTRWALSAGLALAAVAFAVLLARRLRLGRLRAA
jgi:hypothetical protein